MADPTHAGGIVVRQDKGVPLYLLVTARRNDREWVLPKGHIEPGESPEQAAIREVREEAGVEADLVEQIGTTTFVVDGRTVRTRFFLLSYLRGELEGEGRRLAWCSFDDAHQRLSFEETRQMLRVAHKLVLDGRLHDR
jgi:8-oxo-dGTP pyrophosphatase MutT (NUDIX family)